MRFMIRTHIEPCRLAKKRADELNRASGAIYTQVLVFHWRTYRHTGHWLSPHAAERWHDRVSGETGLQAQSRDAAQQGFYKACATMGSPGRFRFLPPSSIVSRRTCGLCVDARALAIPLRSVAGEHPVTRSRGVSPPAECHGHEDWCYNLSGRKAYPT